MRYTTYGLLSRTIRCLAVRGFICRFIGVEGSFNWVEGFGLVWTRSVRRRWRVRGRWRILTCRSFRETEESSGQLRSKYGFHRVANWLLLILSVWWTAGRLVSVWRTLFCYIRLLKGFLLGIRAVVKAWPGKWKRIQVQPECYLSLCSSTKRRLKTANFILTYRPPASGRKWHTAVKWENSKWFHFFFYKHIKYSLSIILPPLCLTIWCEIFVLHHTPERLRDKVWVLVFSSRFGLLCVRLLFWRLLFICLCKLVESFFLFQGLQRKDVNLT